MKTIYLDHAAGTPLDENVSSRMKEVEGVFGNPGSHHALGREAKKILEETRVKVARSIGGLSEEIIFTSSASESNNLAILGVFEHLLLEGKKYNECHAITTVIEHPSVLEVFRHLETLGVSVTYLPIDGEGNISLQVFREAIREETVLVSVMHGNNEIGSVLPIEEIGKIIDDEKRKKESQHPLFHTDACQSFAYREIKVNSLRVDLLTLNSAKIYGPKGAGVLFVRRGTPLSALMHGGAHERGMRPGTPDLERIVGCGEAIQSADMHREEESVRILSIKKYFEDGIRMQFPFAIFNSREEGLPHIVNVSFPPLGGEQMASELDVFGVCVGTRSACKGDEGGISYVVQALGKEFPEGAVRFSLGKKTTKEDIDTTLSTISRIISKYR